jgi:uncharacterized iron-regulated membrane protein
MTFRKIAFWLHLIGGCLAGLVILILSFTGLLLAYERQIIAWIDRDFRIEDASRNSVRLSPTSLMSAVADRYHTTPATVTLRSGPADPMEISLARNRVLLVNPYNGNVLGESAPRARRFFEEVENWHRWLAMSNEHRAAGRAITGACNVLFLLLVVSGPFLWLPRRWSWQSVKAVTIFRGGVSGRARDFNWHNVIGIWSAVPLAVVVASGVVMSYPWANNLLFRLTGSEPPAAAGGPRADIRTPRPSGALPSLEGLDDLWRKAQQQVPRWRSLTLRLPPSGRGPLTFTIDTGNGGRPDRRAQITLNRRGEIVRWEPFSSFNTGRQLRSWLRFLHTGEAGGMPGQTVAGAASAGAVVLVWTGLALAVRRFLRWRKGPREQTLPREDRTVAVTPAASGWD